MFLPLILLGGLAYFLLSSAKSQPIAVSPDGNFVTHQAQGNFPQWVAFTTAGKKWAYVGLSALQVASVAGNPGQGSGIVTMPLVPGQADMNQTIGGFLQQNPGVSAWVDPNLSQVVFTPKGSLVGFPYILLTASTWPTDDMSS